MKVFSSRSLNARRGRPTRVIAAHLSLLWFLQLLPVNLGNDALVLERVRSTAGKLSTSVKGLDGKMLGTERKNRWEQDVNTNLHRTICLRGGGYLSPESRQMSNKERWEACGYSLQPGTTTIVLRIRSATSGTDTYCIAARSEPRGTSRRAPR
eukprot:475956-Rhodomonas_salina.1